MTALISCSTAKQLKTILFILLTLIELLNKIESSSVTSNLVTTSSKQTQSNSKTASLANGGFVIVYNGEYTNSSGSSITTVYARIFSSTGTPVANEFIIPSDNRYNNLDAQVCSFTNGNFVVIWTQAIYGNNIFSKQFSNDGTVTISDTKLTNAQNTSSSQGINLAVGCFTSSYMVAYTTEANQPGIKDLYGVNVYSFGNISSPYAIASNGKSHSLPIISTLPTKAIITWVTTTSTASDIAARMYDNSGGAMMSTLTVSSSASDIHTNPAASFLDTGGFVITWSRQAQTFYIKAQLFDEQGNSIGDAFTVNKPSTINEDFSVVKGHSGGFIVAWLVDSSNYYIKSQKYSSIGTTLDSEFTMSSSLTLIEYPNLSVLNNNNIAITWTGMNQASSTSDLDVLYSLNSFPTCKNLNLSLNSGQTESVNFFSLSQSDSLQLQLTSLPLSVSLIVASTGNPAALSTTYSLTDLTATASNVSSDCFTYIVLDSEGNESSSCTFSFNITLCFLSCSSCGGKIGDTGDNKCTTCATNYYPLYDRTSQCYLSTENVKFYYFDPSTNKFLSCPTYCENCSNGNSCNQCVSTYTWDSGNTQCTNSCGTGFWYNSSSSTCDSCISNCDVCSDNIDCIYCSTGYLLDSTNQCTINCPTGYYGNTNTKTCDECPHNCSSCSDGLTCTTCSNAYFLDSFSNCVSSCSSGYWSNSLTQTCDQCISNCSICTDGSSCLECSPSYFLFSSTCHQNCPLTSWANLSTKTCDPCLPNCDICTTGTTCQECSNDFYLDPNLLCVTTCPYGYSANSSTKTCQPTQCANFCSNCESYITNCPNPPYFYLDKSVPVFKSCYSSCKECSQAGDSATHNCNVCKDYFYIISGTVAPMNCYNDTPAQYFLDNSIMEYKPCYFTCETCSASGDSYNNNCITCISGYYPIEDHPTNCFNSAPPGYYFDTSSQEYKKCYTSCETCPNIGSSSTNNCFTCKTGYYPLKDKPSQCANSTPQGYYFDSSSSQYVPCYSSCASCSGTGDSSHNNCLTCAEGFYPLQDSTSQCINKSPSGYYFDLNSSVFAPCFESCLTCSNQGSNNENNCLSCKTGYYEVLSNSSMCIKDHYTACGLSGGINNEINILKILNYSPKQFSDKDIISLNIKFPEILDDNNPLTQITSVYLTARSLQIYKMNIDSVLCQNLSATAVKGKIPAGEYTISIVDGNENIISSPKKLIIIQDDFPFPPITDWDSFEQEFSKYLNNLYDKGETVNPTVLFGSEGYVQYYNSTTESQETANYEALNSRISFVDSGKCGESLREYYKIPSTESLIYLKIDNITSNADNAIDFVIFDQKGNELDLSHCKNEIAFQLPVNFEGGFNLTFGAAYQKKGIGIFNSSDPFYNDFCYSYNDGTSDFTLNMRRTLLYPNVTIDCGSGCFYKGIDYVTNYTNCHCNPNSAEQIVQNIFNRRLEKLNEINLQVVKCYNPIFVFNSLTQNYGFYFSVVAFGILIGGSLIITFIYTPISKDNLVDIIKNDCVTLVENNKPNKKEEENNNNTDDNNPEKVEVIPANPTNNDLNTKQRSKTNSKEAVSVEMGKTKNDNQIHKLMVAESVEDFNNFNHKENPNARLQPNKVDNIKLQMNSALGLTRGPSSKESSRLLNHFEEVEEKNKNQHIYTQKIYYTYRDYEQMEFEEVITKDKRPFCKYYWKLIIFNHDLLSIIYKNSLIVPLPIRFFNLVISLLIDLGMNALLYTNAYIEDKYFLNKSDNPSTFLFELPRSCYSALSSCFIMFFLQFLLKPSKYAEDELNDSLKTGEMQVIENSYSIYVKRMRWKYVCYFSISILIYFFFCYYIMCFCGVYTMSQSSWLAGGMLGFAIRICVLNVISPLLKATNRQIAIKLKSKCLYKYNYPIHWIFILLS